jgi:acetolactate synthase regulatory subunit
MTTYKSFATVTLTRGRTVRVWRTEVKLEKEYDNRDVTGAIIMDSQADWKTLAEKLMKLQRVVKVEIVENDGHGVCIEK